MREAQQQARKHPADEVADDGNGRVAPIRSALAGDGQNRMDDARPQIVREEEGRTESHQRRKTELGLKASREDEGKEEGRRKK